MVKFNEHNMLSLECQMTMKIKIDKQNAVLKYMTYEHIINFHNVQLIHLKHEILQMVKIIINKNAMKSIYVYEYK